MENEIKYKGKVITVKFPSGIFEYYSDKEGKFLKFDTLKGAKESINKEPKDIKESVGTKKIKLSEIRQLVRSIIKESQLNEISSDTFRSAVAKSDERGTKKRSNKFNELFFNKFIGKELMGSKIKKILLDSDNGFDDDHNPIDLLKSLEEPYSSVIVLFNTEIVNNDNNIGKEEKINRLVYKFGKGFDSERRDDYWFYSTKIPTLYEYIFDEDDLKSIENIEIDRKDAVILSNIAKHIYPNTKYKQIGNNFKIKGYQ